MVQAHGHYRLTRQVVLRASVVTGLNGLLDLTSRSVARATLIVNLLLCLELETPQICGGDGMAQWGERLVILLEVAMYAPIFYDKKKIVGSNPTPPNPVRSRQ